MRIKAFVSFSVEINGRGFVRNLVDVTPAVAAFYSVRAALRGVGSMLAGVGFGGLVVGVG